MTLPLIYTPPAGGTYQPRSALTGATWEEVERFYKANDPIRRIERASIRQFMVNNRRYLKGRVLDFGAGKPGTCYQAEPYKDLVEGEYFPMDKGDPMPRGLFDAVICTQVLQYIENAHRSLNLNVFACLKDGGHLVLSYPMAWPGGEPGDLWRWTKEGMELLVRKAGLAILSHDLRAGIRIGSSLFELGYGLVATK